MWPDNETDVDLLGFAFLVDELLVLLKEPRLHPVTIGVTGDWGSGKSSLLAMAGIALESDADSSFIVVRFGPWKFEGYEDIKAALMQTVMRSLLDAVKVDKTECREGQGALPSGLQRLRQVGLQRQSQRRLGVLLFVVRLPVPRRADHPVLRSRPRRLPAVANRDDPCSRAPRRWHETLTSVLDEADRDGTTLTAAQALEAASVPRSPNLRAYRLGLAAMADPATRLTPPVRVVDRRDLELPTARGR